MTVHPKLETELVKSPQGTFLLLGYILDPENPKRTNRDILMDLAHESEDSDACLKKADNLAGRYVIIHNLGEGIRIWNDPAGIRPVFYAKTQDGVWCSSIPSFLADTLDIDIDEDVKREFIDSEYYSSCAEPWYPGNSTQWKEIKHLTPNNFLTLPDCEVTRFWPIQPLENISLEDCVKESSAILQGILQSAANRYPLAIGISAGLDSRVLLSASRNVSGTITYVTYPETKKLSETRRVDVAVATALLKKLKQKHVLLRHAPLDMFVSGNGSETARCYNAKYNVSDISSAELARIANMEGNRFAITEFSHWLEKTKFLNETTKIDTLDLFHLEQKVANWAAMKITHNTDVSHDTLLPFNSRRLLSLLLSVPREYRMPPNHQLHLELIKHMWPECLCLPINPESRKGKWKRISFRIFKRVSEQLHLYSIYRKYRDRLKPS